MALADSSTHVSTDWQVASDAAFSIIVKSSLADATNKVSWTPTALVFNTNYFVRARHRSSNGKVSAWSSVVTFKTANEFVFNPIIAANVNNYNMKTAAIAAGWDQILPLNMTVTINSGVTVGSSVSAKAGLDTGSLFPVSSRLAIINNGTLRGYIADAGTALKAQVVLSVDNRGLIIAGDNSWYDPGRPYIAPTAQNGYWQDTGSFTNDAPYSSNRSQSVPSITTVSTGTIFTEWVCSGTGSSWICHSRNYRAVITTPASPGQSYIAPSSGGGLGNAVVGNSNITWVATGTRSGALV